MVLIWDWSVCLTLKMIHWHFTIHLPVDHLIDNRSLSRHTLYLSAVLLSGTPWTWADSTSSLALFFTIRKRPITSTLRFRLTPRAAAFLAKKTLSINKLVDNKNQEESNLKLMWSFWENFSQWHNESAHKDALFLCIGVISWKLTQSFIQTKNDMHIHTNWHLRTLAGS